MSATRVPIRPVARATRLRLAFGLLLLILAGVGLAWLSASRLRPDVTATGLQFRTLKAGEGPTIKADDGVVIFYEGSLPDGTVFESNFGKQPLPVIAGQMIPGFSEALQKMQKGGLYRIRIPADQAYGAEPQPGSPIPPNSDLLFRVEVVQVVPNAAQMMGPQGAEALPPGAEALPQGR